MKNPFRTGDRKTHTYTVLEQDVAAFNGKIIHPVCSTYALAREMEWAGRLFVLEMIEPHEEGVGTMVDLKHISPARVGESLVFRAVLSEVDEKGNVICDVQVENNQRKLVAAGSTGQRILTKEQIRERFS